MSFDDNKDIRAISKILLFAADPEIDAEAARGELSDDGVDVTAAFASALEFVTTKRREHRLRWQELARTKAGRFASESGASKYSEVRRPDLIALLRSSTVGHVSFRNFDELTDEDIRSLLEDRDALEKDEN